MTTPVVAGEKPVDSSGRLAKYRTAYADEQYIPDITVQWMYRPHTILAIFVTVGFLIYYAWNSNSELESAVTNTKRGIFAAIFFILMLGLMVFPSGPFIRPHPILWRLVFGVGVVYEIFLIILLFQNKSGARFMMTHFDDRLNRPLEERSYAEHCEVTWENVKGNLFDIFVIGHFVGWVLKSLIIRDMTICWFISITWEILEMLFVHMLPNFAECWWDQWILDVLICNGLGIYVGHKLCKYFEVKKYDWKSVHEYPKFTDKVKRVLSQISSPESWTTVRWDQTSSLKRFFGVHLLVLAIHLEELNAFFLKYLLWVPPESSLNMIRLLFWFFFSLPCLRQFYVYMTDPTVKSIGRQSFLSLVILSTEILVILKLSKGEFTTPMSQANYILMWVCIAAYVAFCIWGVWYILSNSPTTSKVHELSEKLATVDKTAAPLRPKVDEQVLLVAARVVSEQDREIQEMKQRMEFENFNTEEIVAAVLSPRSRNATRSTRQQQRVEVDEESTPAPTSRKSSRSRTR